MVKDLVPIEVHPNSATPDFWRRYHVYRRLRGAEANPDDPLRPDDIEEQRMRHPAPFEIVYRFEISRDGEMLSWFTADTARPGTPGYDTNKHFFGARWSVLAGHRRQGIGSAWLPVVLELMDRHGCTTLTIGTDEDSGRAFLDWLGAEAKLNEAENRLQMADVDWSRVSRWVVDGQKRSPKTRLESYDGPIPESMWEDYAPQLESLLNTMPSEQLDQGRTVVTREHVREWYARMEMLRERSHTMLTREPNGVLSGMTEVKWAPYHPAVIYQQFTGVRPDSRGRGLGKWIKAAMLAHVHKLYPDVEWIVTGNAQSNAPMLAINKGLGFKFYRSETIYQLGRDSLAARAREIERRA